MAPRSNSQKTQQRGRETRRKLIEHTKALLATYDYGSVTLDQVAADVGVSKSSILWHFGSKEALLTEAVFALFEEVDAKITLEKSNLESLEERVGFLLREVGAYFNQNPAAKGVTITLIFNRSVPDAVHERIREQWDAHVEEIQRFLGSDDIEISATCASAILAIMHGCYLQWYLQGQVGDMRQQLPDAFLSLAGEVRGLIAKDNEVRGKKA